MSDSNETGTDDSNETGNSDDAQTASEDIPYDDLDATFELTGELVAESDVDRRFDVIPSNDDRLDGVWAYEEFFQNVEAISEEDREEGIEYGLHPESVSLERDSEEGIELRETVRELRSAMDNPSHPNDRASTNWATHYLEHDWAIVRVYLLTSPRQE